jgi:hypothetical protein
MMRMSAKISERAAMVKKMETKEDLTSEKTVGPANIRVRIMTRGTLPKDLTTRP